MEIQSGLYVVSLTCEELISVRADDPRAADKVLKVNREHCKFGKAKNLEKRRNNYVVTFGEKNILFTPLAILTEIARAEGAVLKELRQFRVRGPSGRLNEWMKGVSPGQVAVIVFDTLVRLGITHEKLVEPQ